MAGTSYQLLSIDPVDSSTTGNRKSMNRFVASIAGIAFMATASLASADCISDCEANCLFAGDPGSIGLCIAGCPAACTPAPVPACNTTGGVNGCSSTAVVLTPSNTGSGGKWTLTNDGSGGSAKAFMTLSCSNVAVIKTAFKGSRTINPGSAPQIGCGSLGFTFSSTCGRNNTCSGGVN